MQGGSHSITRWRVARAALAGMSLLLITCGVVGSAAAWSEFGVVEEAPTGPTGGSEILEPFFDFLLGIGFVTRLHFAAEKSGF